MLRLLAGIIVAASAAGAGLLQAVPDASLQAPFVLAPGQETRIAETGVNLRFEGVTADSRCPADAQCAWAGDAAVEIELRPAKGDNATIVLHTMPRLGNEAEFDGFVIRLEALEPQPRSDRPIPAGDYRATLLVRRN